MNTEKIFSELVDLHKKYYSVHRRTIALDKYDELDSRGFISEQNIEPDDNILRESLLEHVGSLPIVAAFLYPHLEHKEQIDLGKVLKMIAIHDIGETVVGDGHPHQKTESFIESEYQAAIELLPEEYHPLLDEYEERETFDAKFAKSVDVFATFLSDQVLPPEFVRRRLRAHGFSWKEIGEKRYEIYAWDGFLKELFKVVVERYQKIDV